ncbi:MAG: glutamate mutase L, partial [Dermatophilaceae bacterium]
GVLRHGPPDLGARVLRSVLTDHAGGWRVPAAATTTIDQRYLLFAVGLLADHHPTAAEALARTASPHHR